MILSKKKIFILCFILCSCFSFAQKRIIVKYYENNKQLPIENASFVIITKHDTITPKIKKGKIELPKDMTDNFSLFAKMNGKTLKIGSYRVSMFEEIDEIIIGRITDFSTLKESWEFNNTFVIDKVYLITIPNSSNIEDLIYSIIVKQVNVSLISDFKHYIPSFTDSYEVIKEKNKTSN